RAVATPRGMSPRSVSSRLCRMAMSACISLTWKCQKPKMARPDTTTKAPIWPYHGSLLRERFMALPLHARAGCRRARRRRGRGLGIVEGRLHRELDQIAGFRIRGDLAVDDVDRFGEPGAALETCHEIREPRHGGGHAAYRQFLVLLGQLGEPQPIGHRLADLGEHVDGAGLAAAKLLDQRHPLLQLRLARLELLHLREDRSQLLRLDLRPRDVVVELR